jgi:hypothetical protein
MADGGGALHGWHACKFHRPRRAMVREELWAIGCIQASAGE